MFYQIQQTMFTPNKKKSRHSKLLCESFQNSDFIELCPATQPLKPRLCQESDKQNIAKDILIQIGQSQFGTSDKVTRHVPLSIDSWVAGPLKTRNPLKMQRTGENNFMFTRNSRSVTAGLIKYKDDQQENTLLKLKEALKKLQSPEKPKSKAKKGLSQNKNQMLQSLMSKRKIQTKVSDLIRLKECENSRAMGTSSQFNYRKISSSMENRIKKVEPPLIFAQPLSTKKVGETFNFNYKQARKNRTLKGILH